MLKQRTKRSSKITAIILSLMMVVVFMPTFAFAADGDADGITVYMTISDQGELAETKDGSAMAWKEVVVKDADNDGKYTFDEALAAAHDTYTEGGAAANYEVNSGGMVKTLWGEETTYAMFFTNDVAIPNGVQTDEVKAGDYLLAALLADDSLYSDFYATFDQKDVKKVAVNEDVTLKLQGHPCMAFDEETNKMVPIPEADVTDAEGNELGKTDENGNVTLKFSKPGTYVVTADGSMETTVTNWAMQHDPDKWGDDNYYLFDDELFETMGFGLGYTEEDMGEGPYPLDDVIWIDYADYSELEDDFDGHFLKSNQFIVDGAITAPAIIFEVAEAADPVDVTVTVNNKGKLAKAKDGGVMAEKKVTVKDINIDGHLTVDEALVAAHEKYHADGAAAYATGDPWGYGLMVTKLWGVDTTNTLFYVNDQGLATGVTDDEVKEGDSIYASVNADDMYYADWYSTFTEKNAAVEVNLPANGGFPDGFTMSVDVELVGHLGMGYTPEQLKNVPLEGIQIGFIDNRGEFAPLEGAVTDASGKATATFTEKDFDKVGNELVLTAKGTVKDEVTIDYSTGETAVVDCPIMAPYMVVEADVKMGGKVDTLRAEAAQELMASFDMSDYRLKEQLQVLTLVVKAQAEFSNAKTSNDIKRILNDAKDEIAAITTDAQYKAQEAAVKKIQVKGVKVTAGKKQATVKWTKNTKFDGYQISYKKAGASAKTVKVTKNTTVKKVIKKLAKGKKYTFKVRGFKKIDGKVIYGKWSAAKTKKIK